MPQYEYSQTNNLASNIYLNSSTKKSKYRLFGGLTGVLGKTVGMGEIVETFVGDQVKLLAENKFHQLWNNASRNRYFKVGCSDI